MSKQKGSFMVAELVKTCLQCRRPRLDSWDRKVPWRRDRLPTLVFGGFPGDSDGKESACNVGDLGVIRGLWRSPEGGRGNPLQYSCLENPLGQRNLAGYSPWGCKDCDMSEQLSTQHRKKMLHIRTEISKIKKQTIDMMNRAKYCFFNQTYKIDKNLGDSRKKKRGNSLMIQGLGLCAFTAEDPGYNPWPQGKLRGAAGKRERERKNS